MALASKSSATTESPQQLRNKTSTILLMESHISMFLLHMKLTSLIFIFWNFYVHPMLVIIKYLGYTYN